MSTKDASRLAALRRRIRPFLARSRAEVLELLLGYIAHPSTRGNEFSAQRYIHERFAALGVPTQFVPIPESLKRDPEYAHGAAELSYEDRPNVVARLAGAGGRGGGKSLILNSHSDVVPSDGWEEAFQPRLSGNRLYGRGAADDKGQAGISWLVLKFLREQGVRLGGDLEVQLVIDEEVGGNGTLALLRDGHRADGALVLESSELDIHPGHRGALWFRLELTGKAAHMARRHEGVNAIELAVEAMALLRSYEARLIREAGRPRLFPYKPLPIQVNCGMIRGGTWPSSVPASCVLEGGVGFLPPRTCRDVRRELAELFRRQAGPWLKAHHRFSFVQLHNDPYAIATDHPLVTELDAAARRCGLRPRVRGAIASSDARLFHHVGGMPVVVFGPPRGKARSTIHGRGEYLPVADLLKAAEVVIHFVLDWCGVAERR